MEKHDRVRLYERHVAAHPFMERKGATMFYTSVNGHMFSCLNKQGEIGLRLLNPFRELLNRRL
jgi:hypothetical protein